jgi:CBS domain containing-hemolysin-like protein
MGILPKFQETLIHRALELDDVAIREIMTPRQKIFSLPSNMLIEEAGAKVLARHHSRVPVYDEARGPEHIVGVVYSKDLARLMFFRSTSQRVPAQPQPLRAPSFRGLSEEKTGEGVASLDPQSAPDPGASGLASEIRETTNPSPTEPHFVIPFVELRLRQVMREVLVVPETKSVLDLIRDFQQRRRHMAVVVDEFGSIVGLVTAEDAVEQLAGEFEDEFDAPNLPVLTTASGALLMDGGVNLRDLETQMQWSLPREGGVETLAGFLLVRLGHIPHPGEFILYQGRRLTVVEMEARRISRIRVEPVEEEALPAAEGKK